MLSNVEKCPVSELTAQGSAGDILQEKNKVLANGAQVVDPETLVKNLNEKVQKTLWQDPVIRQADTGKHSCR